jgi:hypothetical protein
MRPSELTALRRRAAGLGYELFDAGAVARGGSIWGGCALLVQQSAPSRQHRAIAKDGGQFVLVWVGETLIGSCYRATTTAPWM